MGKKARKGEKKKNFPKKDHYIHVATLPAYMESTYKRVKKIARKLFVDFFLE